MEENNLTTPTEVETKDFDRVIISFEAARLPNESYELYKQRQKIANKAMKMYKKGDVVSFRQHLIMQAQAKERKLI